MQSTVAADLAGKSNWLTTATLRARAIAPTRIEWLGALTTTVLLVLSFPNFNLAPLAWIALVPLLVVVMKRPSPGSAFVIGWASGSVFFYVTCYWLTYSMIHYGGIPALLAYGLLIPGALVVGMFPALFAALTAFIIKRWGPLAVLVAPFTWATFEWFRLGVTGQLWNAIGYSQAEFYFALIFPARWGGVYAVGFLIVAVNAGIALAILMRQPKDLVIACLVVAAVPCVIFASWKRSSDSTATPTLYVIAVQPNVPMTMVKTVTEMKELLDRHLALSIKALNSLPADSTPRLVVWPESPMNFTYANDRTFQELVTTFTRENHTSLIFNSLEPGPNDGSYNSALLINDEGRLISQYDKIRLMPFGEYVPVPQWLGGSLISGLVGEFTPGDKYTLMPVGNQRVGVFICIESAYPWIPRRLTAEGADVLINISNDGYLGPTAVMRQHLANTIFRAVENGRPLLRVTNTGLSASIRANGFVEDITSGYQADVRTWKVGLAFTNDAFYTRHGDIFVQLCAVITIASLLTAVYLRRSSRSLR